MSLLINKNQLVAELKAPKQQRKMQGVAGGAFLLPSHSSTAIPTQNRNLFFNPFSFTSYKPTNFPFSFLPLPRTRTGVLSISASSKRRTGDGNGIGTSSGDRYGEEKMMLMMPFDEMRRWLNNKPPGFGEGKTYDTSIEEKLMEEIEQSRQAQLANISKLKNAGSGTSKKQTQKAPEDVQNGIQVRVGNLPKKRNIHRDLQLAFKGFPGLVHIHPAVSGNKKTRDPVCKGFAFLYFESEETAYKFAQTYFKGSIQFGKIQKQITCEITDPQYSSKQITGTAPPAAQSDMEEGRNTDSDRDDLSWDDSEKETFSEEESESELDDGIEYSAELIYLAEDEDTFSEWEDIDVDAKHVNVSESSDRECDQLNQVAVATKQQSRGRVARKRQKVKEKTNKGLKLEVPGSAKRLKIRERTVLTGVFSKYGRKADAGSSSS